MNKSVSGRVPWLLSAAAAALAAAALRCWQLSSAFEPSGLAAPGAQASVILVCVLFMTSAWFILLAMYQPLTKRPMTLGQAHRWDLVFLDAGDPVYPALAVLAAFLALTAVPVLLPVGLAQWQHYRELLAALKQGLDVQLPSNNGMLTIATGVGALLSALGLLQMGRDGLRPGRRGKGGFSAALPGVAGCVWLMESFRAHAANPVRWDYAPQLIAIVAGMAFYMDFAGMSAGAPRPRRLLWLAGMSAILSAASLVSTLAELSLIAGRPDGTLCTAELGDALLLLSQTLAAAGVLWRLPPNLENPPKPPNTSGPHPDRI